MPQRKWRTQEHGRDFDTHSEHGTALALVGVGSATANFTLQNVLHSLVWCVLVVFGQQLHFRYRSYLVFAYARLRLEAEQRCRPLQGLPDVLLHFRREQLRCTAADVDGDAMVLRMLARDVLRALLMRAGLQLPGGALIRDARLVDGIVRPAAHHVCGRLFWPRLLGNGCVCHLTGCLNGCLNGLSGAGRTHPILVAG